jgi:hypothetical protein
LAQAVVSGEVPVTPEVVALLFRCDDCSLCSAASSLREPPDLARTLWPVRAWLVEQGAAPEAAALSARCDRYGHIYGDLSEAWARLGSGAASAASLFVPDGAVLAYDPEAALAALWAARAVAGAVAISPAAPDSGRVMLELGLAQAANDAHTLLREMVGASDYRQVLAGTPKEAAALREALAGLPVQVEYVGAAFARAMVVKQGIRLASPAADRRVVLHPSAAFRQRPDDLAVVERLLAGWLGESFRPEPAALGTAWPAAVERPAIGLDPALARKLAVRRMTQLLALGTEVILTTDPFSKMALSAVAPTGIEVLDLLSFAAANSMEA